MPLDRLALQLRTRHCYRSVFASPEGRVVLNDLLKFCGVGRASFAPGMAAPDVAFAEGRRRVGLRILSLIGMTDEQAHRLANSEDDHDQ